MKCAVFYQALGVVILTLSGFLLYPRWDGGTRASGGSGTICSLLPRAMDGYAVQAADTLERLKPAP
jgi:hypothetical protein